MLVLLRLLLRRLVVGLLLLGRTRGGRKLEWVNCWTIKIINVAVREINEPSWQKTWINYEVLSKDWRQRIGNTHRHRRHDGDDEVDERRQPESVGETPVQEWRDGWMGDKRE
jgi:hypothetical protein